MTPRIGTPRNHAIRRAIFEGAPWTELTMARPVARLSISPVPRDRAPMARSVAIRHLIATPSARAGQRQMARRQRWQALRVYRHALWHQVSGLLIVLAIGVGCCAEAAGLWTLWGWLRAGLHLLGL